MIETFDIEADGVTLYLEASPMDYATTRIQFVTPAVTGNIDLDLISAMNLRDALIEHVQQLFAANDMIKCPACNYTQSEAQRVGDHQNCRRFPFFPDEHGESYAKPR